MLTKSPREMSIWDIVNVVEPIKRFEECPLGIQSHGSTLCPLHRRLDRAVETVETIFRETTVAELLSEPGSVTPLCEEHKIFGLDVPAPKPKKKRRKPSAKEK